MMIYVIYTNVQSRQTLNATHLGMITNILYFPRFLTILIE